jgi:hypothetical protein
MANPLKKTIKIALIYLGFRGVLRFFLKITHRFLGAHMTFIGRKRDNALYTTDDYVRLSSLELVSHEIYRKNIRGGLLSLACIKVTLPSI